MNKLLLTGRRLFLPLFVVLLLGLLAIPAFADDSDNADVPVTVGQLRVTFLKDGTFSEPPTWATLLGLPDLTNIPFDISQSEIEAGEAYYRNNEEYDGWAIWRANTSWVMRVSRGAWSPDLASYGVKLWLRTDSYSYQEVTGTTPWIIGSDGANFGYFDLDWKLDGLDFDVPPDTYTTTVTFTMSAS